MWIASALRGTAFRDPKSYFHRYATLSDADAVETATAIWRRINLLNLHENIPPTRQRRPHPEERR
jgi:type I pantothenate kinase